jgi:hypothetical protein
MLHTRHADSLRRPEPDCEQEKFAPNDQHRRLTLKPARHSLCRLNVEAQRCSVTRNVRRKKSYQLPSQRRPVLEAKR